MFIDTPAEKVEVLFDGPQVDGDGAAGNRDKHTYDSNHDAPVHLVFHKISLYPMGIIIPGRAYRKVL